MTHNAFDPRVPSNYGYDPNYVIKTVRRQMEILQQEFPFELKDTRQIDLGRTNVPPLLPGAEGYFIIPRWELFASTYGEAAWIVLQKLLSTANPQQAQSYNKRRLDKNYLIQHQKTEMFYGKIAEQQRGNVFLLIQAQFGMRFRGWADEDVYQNLGDNEVGIGLFGCAIMLVTHKERLQTKNDLCITCIGDSYDPFGSLPREKMFQTPGFIIDAGGLLSFGVSNNTIAKDYRGAVSAFLEH